MTGLTQTRYGNHEVRKGNKIWTVYVATDNRVIMVLSRIGGKERVLILDGFGIVIHYHG